MVTSSPRPGARLRSRSVPRLSYDQPLHDRHSQARAVRLGARRIDTIERSRHERQLIFRNARPFVDHAQFDA